MLIERTRGNIVKAKSGWGRGFQWGILWALGWGAWVDRFPVRDLGAPGPSDHTIPYHPIDHRPSAINHPVLCACSLVKLHFGPKPGPRSYLNPSPWLQHESPGK
ncbi:GD12519 [Drosophila simulans]|uniref:GD12519 n=1 Tax=Drosophila simulans TaxID=7240 RepID=B4QLT0_DROSI|nr:GD12519 [Drosophila simulans]